MALIDWAGFEFYVTTTFERPGHSGVNLASESTNVRTGSYAMYLNNNTAWVNRYEFLWSGQNYSEIFMSLFTYQELGTITGTNFIRWMKGSTVLGGLKILSTGLIEAYTGDFATLVGTTTTPLPRQNYRQIEVHIKIDDSAGVLQVKIDGTQEINFSGDTKPGADTGIDKWQIGCINGIRSIYDDVVFHDTSGTRNNSWVGPVRVWRLRPTSDSTPLQWTSSGANHYGVLDETTPADSDYIRSTANNDVDELGLTDLTDVGVIKAVIAHAWAYRGSAVDPQKLILGLDLGGTDYDSAAIALGTGIAIKEKIWEEHPGTSLLFSESDIDGAKLRLKSASGS